LKLNIKSINTSFPGEEVFLKILFIQYASSFLEEDAYLKIMEKKMKQKIYLAGPIFNTEEKESNDWKTFFKTKINRDLFIPIDPIDEFDYKKNPNAEGLVNSDKLSIQRSNIVVANCWKISVGTSMEILYAWERSIPTFIIYREKNLHPWIRYHSTKVFYDVTECVEFLNNNFAVK
jgi:nucleoside 2-deoxyribosyltransferase